MDILDEYFAKLGVLVTSHPKQHIFMDTAFESWAGFEGFMLLGYDDDNTDHLPWQNWSPPITETFITGKTAGWYGHYRGELWQMKIGANRLREAGFEYFYKTAADNCCYRWRNLKRIFKVMNGKGRPDLVICGTTQMFGRVDTLCDVMDLWSDDIKKCGGAECFLYHRLADLGIRDGRFKIPWWNELLGLIHLQGEYALNNGIGIVDTWAIGQTWGHWYPHRDLDPRVKFLKPKIRGEYENFISKSKATRG